MTILTGVSLPISGRARKIIMVGPEVFTPTREDEFSTPFLANIRVGGETRGFTGENPHTRGYNICTKKSFAGCDTVQSTV